MTNGDDSDAQGGGIFLIDEEVGPPTGQWSLFSDEDKQKVLNYIKGVSSSIENLRAALIHPEKSMRDAGLTENQVKTAKTVLAYLGR